MNVSLTTAIYKRVIHAFEGGVITKSGFAETVAQHAPDNAGLQLLSVNMPHVEYEAASEANRKKIWRKINRDTKEFHVDLLLPILIALPEPYSSYLINDIRAVQKSTDSTPHISNVQTIKELCEAGAAVATGTLDEQLKELYEARDAADAKINELLIMRDQHA